MQIASFADLPFKNRSNTWQLPQTFNGSGTFLEDIYFDVAGSGYGFRTHTNSKIYLNGSQVASFGDLPFKNRSNTWALPQTFNGSGTFLEDIYFDTVGSGYGFYTHANAKMYLNNVQVGSFGDIAFKNRTNTWSNPQTFIGSGTFVDSVYLDMAGNGNGFYTHANTKLYINSSDQRLFNDIAFKAYANTWTMAQTFTQGILSNNLIQINNGQEFHIYGPNSTDTEIKLISTSTENRLEFDGGILAIRDLENDATRMSLTQSGTHRIHNSSYYLGNGGAGVQIFDDNAVYQIGYNAASGANKPNEFTFDGDAGVFSPEVTGVYLMTFNGVLDRVLTAVETISINISSSKTADVTPMAYIGSGVNNFNISFPALLTAGNSYYLKAQSYTLTDTVRLEQALVGFVKLH